MGAPARCLAGDRPPPLYGADEVVVGGVGGLLLPGRGFRHVRGGRSPPRTRRPRTAAGPAAADDVVGTTAKDWAHGDVCVGEAETGWGAREPGPAVADTAADKALPCPKLPGLLFSDIPRASPCAPPLATDHCLWLAAGGQGRVRSARGGHTVRGLSVGWRRRFASSAGRQVRSGELRCRRAAASGGTTAGASDVDCRRWTIAGMAGICLRQGRGSSGGLVGRGGRQPQGGGWGWGRQDSHNCKGNGHNVDGRNGDGHGLDRDGHGCNLVRCSRNGEGEGSDGSGSDGNDCDGNGGRSGANQGESGHGGDIQPPPECCGRPR